MKRRFALVTAVMLLVSTVVTGTGQQKGVAPIDNMVLEDGTFMGGNLDYDNGQISVQGNEVDKSSANISINGTMLQYFEWDLPENCNLWKQLSEDAGDLADTGFTSLWLPPAYKGGAGTYDVGYGVYDLYDLGEFNQKGTVRTKYGTKDQYLAAIQAAHNNGIDVYADIVLNHKGSADDKEQVKATMIDGGNRNNTVGSSKTIGAWTKFTFPGRGNKYSSFKWDYTCFDAVDHDANSGTNAIYLFDGKHWDWKVDSENANFDYLMYADIDFGSQKVIDELKSWGKWYVDIANLDGFRIDAVKHIRYSFFSDWLSYLRSATGKELFTVGEFYSNDLWKLQDYITETNRTMSLFDMPLHNHMQEASKSNGYYDMRYILNGTLVSADPVLAVTFVENHDTQPGQSDYSYVLDWFKPLAYTLILTREGGYPCVFYGDYYGLENSLDNSGKSQKNQIDRLMKARTACSYGTQHDYFDHGDIVGWTREGDSSHANSGLASIITDGPGGEKKMYVGKQHAGETWYDITGHITEKVTIDSTGHGVFKVNGGSNSVYVSTKIAAPSSATGNNSATIYYKTNWSTPYAHYRVGYGDWTKAPGVKMTKASNGYYKITIPMGGETKLTVCFNDGGNTWDNNNSSNYTFKSGTYTLVNGKITSGEPSGADDSGSGNSGTGNSGNGNSGTGNSGTGNSGTGNSGTGNSGTGNSDSGNTTKNPETESTGDDTTVESSTDESYTDEETTSAKDDDKSEENTTDLDGDTSADSDDDDDKASENNKKKDGKSSKDKGSPWVIILVVSGVIAVIAVGGFFAYKKLIVSYKKK